VTEAKLEPEAGEPTPRKSLIPPSGPVAPDTAPAPAPVPVARSASFDPAGPAVSGLGLRELTPTDKTDLKIPEKLHGVVITEVDPRSGAAEAALLPGDVIVRANFAWLDTQENTLDKLVADRGFTALTVYRNGVPFDVVLHKPFDPTKTATRTAP
jgi:S1-C subfamily serine protease